MHDLDRQVSDRRARLGDPNFQGHAHKWGLALSGGGIRSATFCLGLLRALAHQNLLLRFDLLSTVSGGGYIGATLGRLFDRATTPADLHRIERALGNGDASWFMLWLRSNGRYLIPLGTKDRTFAIALFLRNLVGIHFELGLLALALGLLLAGIDLSAWWALKEAGYAWTGLFEEVRWLPAWMPVLWLLLPVVAGFGAVFGAAHWALPWLVRRSGSTVAITWLVVAAIAAGLAALFLAFDDLDVQTGQRARRAVWMACLALIATWLLAAPVALRTWKAATAPAALRIDAARSRLTRRLANVFRWFAVVAVLGLVDRVAWYFAFERPHVADIGLWLAGVAAILRALLPLASGPDRSPRSSRRLLMLAHVAGFALAFVLCAWWVSLVHKTVLGAIFAKDSVVTDNGLEALLLLLVPVIGYLLLTGRNAAFLNVSSLHAFYRARLSRGYLGAANASRFGLQDPLGTLSEVAPELRDQPVPASVEDVHPQDDCPIADYCPQRAGGPIHLINICLNQTKDPRGRHFNQDRKGLLLTVASGGSLRIAQRPWSDISPTSSPTLSTWIAISGAAVAPGLGAMTRGGIATLAMFSGLRLGYWWSRTDRAGQLQTSADGPGVLAKSKSLLRESVGVFAADDRDDWFLSDGGHFENTGAYALLAERAELIMMADCGADPRYAFGDLENLVRKARIDLQAEIHFMRPKKRTRPQGPHASVARCAADPDAPALPAELAVFGSLNDLASAASTACLALARVKYEGGDTAILILIKPNLCTGLPVDLVNFKAENPDFPQQTTVDQFFSEAQWESYHQLGQFLGGRLPRHFIQRLIDDPGEHFEDDDCSPFDKHARISAAAAAQEAADGIGGATDAGDGGASTSRVPARVRAAAIGTTLGVGAAATVGVSVWQAIDSLRSAAAKQTADERAALKDLSDLWAKLPAESSLHAAMKPGEGASASAHYGELAAALVRTADTLCPASQQGWFDASPLAKLIYADTLRGCRALPLESRQQPCRALVEASLPELRSPLLHCLRRGDEIVGQLPARYWVYDYTLEAKKPDMHPCDPQRASLRSAEDDFEARGVPLVARQTSPDPNAPVLDYACELPSQRSVVAAAPASRPAPGASAAVPILPSSAAPASVAGPASGPPPGAASAPPLPPAPSAGSGPTLGVPTSSRPTDVCKGMVVYVQTYGAAERELVQGWQAAWRQDLQALVPRAEDVVATARGAGRIPPLPVRQTTVRYHDEDGIACANKIAATGGREGAWKVEPLSARLKPSRHVIEVWVKPTKADADAY